MSEVAPRQRGAEQTTLGPSLFEQVLIWIGFPLGGLVAGWLVKIAGAWAATQPWLPVPGRFRIVTEFAHIEPQATIVALLLGAIVGLVVAVYAVSEQLHVTVGDDEVVLVRDGDRRLDRAAISAVFLDDKELVIQGHSGEEHVREPTDLDARDLATAFAAHGYPWVGVDPHAVDFRSSEDPRTADLAPGVAGLLRARARALARGDDDEAATLRAELAHLGIVVREQDKADQRWRQIEPE